MRPYRSDANEWEVIGKTPVKKIREPMDDFVWRISKSGLAPIFMIARPAKTSPPPGSHSTFNFLLKLRPAASVPGEMVVVPSLGPIGLAYPYGTGRLVRLHDFLIDRHEVTNEDYKKFIDAGGYREREFWKQPFLKDGRTLSFENAIALFHDATGRPGPATWELGDYPKGRARHPVAGVNWFEAAAYAEFMGKNLPTAYHWAAASQSLNFTPLITARSNFRQVGTSPVGSPGTLSGFGTTDMAGNVKEWCWNEAPGGKRFIMGGGFDEPNYNFHHTDAQSPWDRLADFGFRCVKYDHPPMLL